METVTDTMKYKVKDISLAEFGRKEIEIAEKEMPGLLAIRYKYAAENKDLKYHFLASFDRQITGLHNRFRILDDPYVNRIYENNNDKVIVFSRGGLLFVFNFNPSVSFTDYGIPIQGKFSIVIDSDDPGYGGFDRIERSSIYMSVRRSERHTLNEPLYLYLYLPSRTALVLKKETVRRATEI